MPLNETPTASASGHLQMHAEANKAINQLYEGSGWRAVTSLLENGWTASSVRIRRRADRVELLVKNLSGAAATADTILSAATTAALQPYLTANGEEEYVRLIRPSGSSMDLVIRSTGISTSSRLATVADGFVSASWNARNRVFPTVALGSAVA